MKLKPIKISFPASCVLQLFSEKQDIWFFMVASKIKNIKKAEINIITMAMKIKTLIFLSPFYKDISLYARIQGMLL